MTLNKIRQKVKKKKLWAIYELARRYEYGNGGVELSLDKAIDHYKKGMELGDPSSMNQLGAMYDTGKGVATNKKLAFEYYQMGALKGFDMAQFNVGACYYSGLYVNQSNTKAREWFNRAAVHGFEAAIKQLKFIDEKEKAEEEEKSQTTQEKETEEEEATTPSTASQEDELSTDAHKRLGVEEKSEEETQTQITQEEKETKEATTPTTTVVTKKKHRLYCLNCTRPYTNQTKHMFRRCSMCHGRDAIFCGPLCQELTWPDHREECIRIGIILHNY